MEISTRSQTDTKSTQTDTRSQTVVKQTSRSERTHIRLRRLTALPPSLSLTTPDATGNRKKCMYGAH